MFLIEDLLYENNPLINHISFLDKTPTCLSANLKSKTHVKEGVRG